jgi:PTS system cellobiose-specific IIB component
MKILLACAGGFSTSYLMNKLKKYFADTLHEELVINAVGVGSIGEEVAAHPYDVVLVGPQAGYMIDEAKKSSGLPCAVIPPADYGIGNCEHIVALAHKTIDEFQK